MGELAGNEPGIPDTWNFSIEVAKGWEEAFLSKATPRTKKIALRSSITFSPDRNGAFDVYRLWFVVALAARKEMVNNMFPRSTKRISSERIA